MTYCVASKGDFSVVMAADSARTGDEPPRMRHSSFGEPHGPLDADGPQRFVQEGKLKIEVIGDCAVTYAGAVHEIDPFIQEFKLWKRDRPALAAFKETAAAQPPCTSQIILGYVDDGEPKIATFNSRLDGQVEDDVDFAEFGNLDEMHRKLTKTYLTAFAEQSNDPIQILVNTLALLQSYGIHNYLISDGVGGGFCGVALNHAGVHWQPDILYLVANEELTTVGMVGSFARDNLWCLFSSMGEAGSVVFGHEREEEATEKLTDFIGQMEDKHDGGRFEYICVLSLKPHSIVVIEMQENRHHRLIYVDPLRDIEKTLGVFWSPMLLEMVGSIALPEGQTVDPDHITVRYIPYWPAGEPPPGLLERLREEGRMFPAPGEE
jgi:hypothetical protein